MLVKNIDQLSDDQAEQLTTQQAFTKFNGLVQTAIKEQPGLDFFKSWNQTKSLWPKTFVAAQEAFKDVGNLASAGATVSTYDPYGSQVSASVPFGEAEQAPVVPLSDDALKALGLDPKNPVTTFDVASAAWKANGYKLTPLNKAAVAEAVSCVMCGGHDAAMQAYPGLFDSSNPAQENRSNPFSQRR